MTCFYPFECVSVVGMLGTAFVWSLAFAMAFAIFWLGSRR